VQIAKALWAEMTAVDSAIKEEMLRRIGAVSIPMLPHMYASKLPAPMASNYQDCD